MKGHKGSYAGTGSVGQMKRGVPPAKKGQQAPQKKGGK